MRTYIIQSLVQAEFFITDRATGHPKMQVGYITYLTETGDGVAFGVVYPRLPEAISEKESVSFRNAVSWGMVPHQSVGHEVTVSGIGIRQAREFVNNMSKNNIKVKLTPEGVFALQQMFGPFASSVPVPVSQLG